MKKDFDKWNKEKKFIHITAKGRYYHEREVWWCAMGINVGFEQDGSGDRFQRPVLVLKGLSANTCLVAPLTKSKEKHKFRIPVGVVDGVEAFAIISQARVIDTKRFTERIDFLKKEVFERIQKAVREIL